MAASPTQYFRQFFYRFNSDSTIDAICSVCYVTVTARNEAELHTLEAAHHCQGGSLDKPA
jgi:hypothetical protein